MDPVTNDNAPVAPAAPDVTPNPNPATPPAAAPYTGPDWIPENLRAHKSLSKFKTAGDAAQAYVNLETKLGQKFAPPADDAPAETKAAWRAAIGVPGKAEEYESPSLPEGSDIKLDEGYLGEFKTKAHEIGLSKSQAKALADWVVGREIKQYTEFQAGSARAKDEGMKNLRSMWGAAAGENVSLIQRLVAETADEKIKSALDRTGFGNDPDGLRWMAKMARSFAEHDLIDPKTVGTTQQEAQAKIDAIKAAAVADKKHPYVNRDHPGHKAAVEEMNALYQIANPEVAFTPGV